MTGETITSYHDLEVWKRSRKLVKIIYQATESFPKSEMFGLTSQMRRAAVSIPSNIAEGFSRHGTKDYISFISICIGSAAELETQVLLGCDLEYLQLHQMDDVLKEITQLHKMLHNMRRSLKSKL